MTASKTLSRTLLSAAPVSIGLALCLLPACAGTSARATRFEAFDPVVAASFSLPAAAPEATVLVEDDDEEHHGVVHTVLLYIPNRIFDVLDIVRARLRVGPGFAIGARATEFADVYLGAYASVWVGLPGPRGEPEINWPFGLESKTGAEVSVADASVEGGVHYGMLECGFGGQLAIIGFDLGVDVFEVADFATGLVTIDISHDDL